MSSYACTHAYIKCLLLLLATTVIAPLCWEFEPQSNNAAGNVVVPKITLLSPTTVLKHKYAITNAGFEYMWTKDRETN